MKGTLVLCTCVLLVAPAFTALTPLSSHRSAGQLFIQQVVRPLVDGPNVGIDKCKTCVEFAEEALNQLLNIILQGGVVGGCADLCNALASKTSPAIGTVCNLLCDIVGIEEFIKLVKKADLDPIYYCELIPVCPVNDNGDAKLTKLEVMPKSGPQGQFSINFEYVSQNGTGTGMLSLAIDTVDKIPLGQDFLNEAAAAGTYNGQIMLKAQPDPSCDPSQGPCEKWLQGTYTVKMAVCNGECGSKHPHSQIYDTAETTFEITN